MPATLISRVTAWVAGEWRKVACSRAGESGYLLYVEGIGAFAIKTEGSAIVFTSPESDNIDSSLIEDALLGPALSLALAARQIFCLHASAWLVNRHAVALIGESGAGKSTLATYVSSHLAGWRRLADDTLPVAMTATGPMAFPRFPQLKLPIDQQVGAETPEQIPLGAVFLLDAATSSLSPALEVLDRRSAASLLVKHTMATSLFDAPLLAAHINFCASAAAVTPVKRLRYPHEPTSLPRALDLMAADGELALPRDRQ